MPPASARIQAYIQLDKDPSEALTQISAKVNKMRGQLPAESEAPVIDLQQGQQIAAMYVSLASDTLDNNQITDYITRVIQPKLVTVDGVQRADILGAGTFAMRIWLKPDRMTAYKVTASDVVQRAVARTTCWPRSARPRARWSRST